MRKIKLIIEYDGTNYYGWQIQKDKSTIQKILEETIQKITKEKSKVISASRTDAGVHALAQVAVFNTISMLEPDILKRALNSLLPKDIHILEVSDVSDSFHPRFNAVKKRYFYIITTNTRSSAFFYKYTWNVQQKLNIKNMKIAAQALIGVHDFSSFQGTGSSIKNPIREIFYIGIEEFDSLYFMTTSLKGNFLKITIEANGFLRYMVRNIVGTLGQVGRGKISPQEMKNILKSRNRKLAGPTAPPNGLFLERIVY